MLKKEEGKEEGFSMQVVEVTSLSIDTVGSLVGLQASK